MSDIPPPPEDLLESTGEAPSPQHIWVPGRWWWNGKEYVWIPGHWETTAS